MYYYIMGIPFDDLWNKPELYVSVNEGALETTLEFEEATKYIIKYRPIGVVKEKVSELQNQFNDYSWCILIK